jgi:hypothetical protein
MGLAEIVVVLLNGLEGEDYATTAEAVSVQDAYGCSALDLAATGGHVEVVRRIEEILAANEGGRRLVGNRPLCRALSSTKGASRLHPQGR